METIKVRTMDARTLLWWNARRKDIDMDPKYQRKGDIWNNAKKAYLIDSIINEYDIPKLYLADFTYKNSPLNSKRKPYAIIDGKQRFQAIFDFFDNKFSLAKNCIFLKDPDLEIANLDYSSLKTQFPMIAEIFDNYNLTIMSVSTDSTRLITDMFVRLNSSQVSLTGAEIRNAMPGRAVEIIQELTKHPFFTKNISFSTKRKSEFDLASKMLLFEYSDKPVGTKKINLDEFVVSSIKNEERVKRLNSGRLVALNTLDKMALVFSNRDKLLSASNPIPVYYWFVRNVEEDNLHIIREFLEDVESIRKSLFGSTIEAITDDDLFNDLILYQNYYSRLNDSVSNEKRYQFLINWFNKREVIFDTCVRLKSSVSIIDKPIRFNYQND